MSGVWIGSDGIVIEVPFSRASAKTVRKHIPEARWDRITETWQVDILERDNAVKAAAELEIPVEDGVLRAPVPKNTKETRTLRIYRKKVRMAFPHNDDLIKAVKQIPGAKWNATSRYWSAPYESLPEALMFARLYAFDIEDGIEAHEKAVLQISRDRAEAFEQSSALTGTIEVPGITLELFDHQKAAIEYILDKRKVLQADDMGLGKATGNSEPVLTPTGWTSMGQISVGDFVIGSDGTPTRVTGVYPQGLREIYRITFSDGSSACCDVEHLWNVRTAVQKRNRSPWMTVTTQQMIDGDEFVRTHENGRTYRTPLNLRKKNGDRNLEIPMVSPVQFDDPGELLIDPYTLGLWLGDGYKRDGSICSGDPEVWEYVPYTVESRPSSVIGDFSSRNIKGLKTKLRQESLLQNKHVPEQYLRASVEDRLALLQGLMDSDGHAGDNSTEFSNTNKRLIDAVVDLTQSLGGVARVKGPRRTAYEYDGEQKLGALSWRVNVKLPPQFNPFRISRKANTYNVPTKYPPARLIESIEYSHNEEATCIRVEAADSLYVTTSYIVTHNTVSSLASVEADEAFPCLIVVPSGLMGDWSERIADWLPHRQLNVLEGRRKSGEVGTEFTLVGDATLTAWTEPLTEQKFQSVIVDEAHDFKNKKSARSKALAAVLKQSKTAKNLVILLTGTPAENNPSELGPQLELLGVARKLFGGLWAYYKEYCGGHQDSYGNWHTSGKDVDKDKLLELNRKLRENCYIRRTKAQVQKDLPKLTPVKKYVELPEHLHQRYYELEDRLHEKKDGFLQFKSEVSQMLAEVKVEVALWHIRDLLDHGEKVVIVAHHKKIIDALTKEFGPLKIDGSVATKKRNEVKAAFREPGARTIVISDDAASTGHDLTASCEIVFIELPWNPARYDQLVSRVHRQGQTRPVTSTIFLVKETYDERHYGMMVNKEATTSRTTQGSASEDMKRVKEA